MTSAIQGPAAQEARAALRKVFGDLAPEVIDDIADGLELLRLPRGRLLYRQGDEASGLHVVLTGRLEVRVATESGERLVGHIPGGDAAKRPPLLRLGVKDHRL